MKHISLNKEVFDRLPDNDVCPEIFVIDESGQLTPSLEPKTQTGGAHLTEAFDDMMDQSSLIHNTGSIVQENTSKGSSELIASLLRSGPIMTERSNNTTTALITSPGSSRTYVVRPSQQFMKESDPFYLEKLFPDYFPFCRGGPSEPRRKRISWNAYVSYILNIHNGSFDNADFVFAVFNVGVRKEMATKAFIRAKLPSQHANSNGQPLPRAAAYTRISTEDMKQLLQYKEKCAEASKKGTKWPPVPTD